MNYELIFGIGFLIFTVIGVLIYVIISKSEQLSQAEAALARLNRSFNDLDEQAKLIVKTDLELNKAQEELDKRLKGLDALQKTSRLISTTLDETEIFHRLDQSLMTDLEFERNIVFLYDDGHSLDDKVTLGYNQDDMERIKASLKKDESLIKALEQGQTFSSINSPKERIDSIALIFDAEHFVISPILTQNGILGVVFVGNRSNAAAITEGDEELVSILANQIGQSLENARLFEQVFRSSQSLESKVHDRTKQLASALEEVQRISKTKSEFISAVSHELRTPLTSIKGYAAILMAGKLGEIPPQVRQRLEKINTHSDNLVKLINDLLDIARIESGKIAMNIGRCNLRTIIDNMHDILQPQLKQKNIQWVCDYDDSIPEMCLDANQIERVFINLVSNAIKFTPEQGTISVEAKKDGERVKLAVSDTGIGIKASDAEKLFDEFYRVDNKINQNVKGTGLGLALVKKIVEAHEGRIWINSKIGEGTTFHFTLPIKAPEDRMERKKDQPAGPHALEDPSTLNEDRLPKLEMDE